MDSTQLLTTSTALLDQLRDATPLVQCLTNTVTPNFVANALLALGASPAMVDVPGEAGPFAAIASGTLINLGTPHSEQRTAMLEAATSAREADTPWVLDPVAVGALQLRTDLAHELVTLKPAIIRGNASEILALAGVGTGGQGVDSLDSADSAAEAATMLARSTGAVVAVSGEIDLITDGTKTARIDNGHPVLTAVTGAGCALGAVAAAFASLNEDRFATTVAACAVYTVAADIAVETSTSPGSFAVAFLDALHHITADDLTKRAWIS